MLDAPDIANTTVYYVVTPTISALNERSGFYTLDTGSFFDLTQTMFRRLTRFPSKLGVMITKLFLCSNAAGSPDVYHDGSSLLRLVQLRGGGRFPVRLRA